MRRRTTGKTAKISRPAVLFDLDGTLTDYRRFVSHTVAQLAAVVEQRAEVDAARFKETYREVQREDEAAERQGLITVAELRDRRRRFSRTLARLGVFEAELVEELAAAYEELRRTTSFAMPGASETLTFLAEREVWIGVVTEGAAREQRGQLAALGWEDRVNDLVISEEAGIHKPDPGLVAQALLHADVAAADAICVGDRAIWDLRPAKDLGLTTVLLVSEAYAGEAEAGAAHIDLRAANHAELRTLLETWLAQRSSYIRR